MIMRTDVPPHPPAATFDWPSVFERLRAVVETLPQKQAAMFQLVSEGYASVFEQVVSAIISVRTTEEVTFPASRRLFALGRSAEAIASKSLEEIERAISPATFAGAKARDILAIAVTTRDEFGGKLPCDVNVLQQFRGVGPKVANLAVAASTDCGEPVGIPVDIHVHRVANRWGVIAANTPERTQTQLERVLPRRYFAEINKLLVPFGKFVCTGVRPKCSTCVLRDDCRRIGVTSHR
jgi:endonuclease-3